MADASLEGYTPEQQAQLARTMAALLNNPDVARDTKRLIKKVDSSVSFADIELQDQFEKLRAEQLEKDKEREEQDRIRRANAEYEKTKERVTSRGFKVEDVEKLMKEKGIASYDTAMEFLDNQSKLAPPTPDSLGRSMELPANAKDINRDPKNWARNEAHAAIDQLRMRRSSLG